MSCRVDLEIQKALFLQGFVDLAQDLRGATCAPIERTDGMKAVALFIAIGSVMGYGLAAASEPITAASPVSLASSAQLTHVR